MSLSVGIAIARKRQQDGRDLIREGQGAGSTNQEEQHEVHEPTSQQQVEQEKSHQPIFRSKGSYQKPFSSSQLFLSGTLLYAACVLLPAAIAILLRKYEEHAAANETARINKENEAGTWTLYHSWDELSNIALDYFCSLYQAFLHYLWMDETTGYELSFCAKFQTIEQGESGRLFWSPDTAWMDLAVVACLSLALATIRMGITRLVVPLEDPRRVEALVKSKSVHLLSRSRDYQLTPVSIRKQLSWSNNSQLGSSHEKLKLPDIHLSQPQNPAQDDVSFADDESIGLRLDTSESQPGPTVFTETKLQPTILPPPPPPPETDDSAEIDDADMEVLQYNAAAVEASRTRDSTAKVESPPKKSNERLHAAPRMASALFRICYSVVASILALYYFRNSNFWPPYVSGTGSTKNCWDLGGSLSVGGMDGDFDHKNTVLRRYFLWQAAYHWHAGAFHIFSSIWLLLLRLQRPSTTNQKNENEGNNQGWTFSYFSATHTRSLASHTLALVLLATGYVFSSLRRLGAIGMFAFDFSSIFLHLLQVCVNSREESPWHDSRRIRFIRNILVLPSFVFCRFFIWPALWWSAVRESTSWLKQLEMTLFAGAALGLKCIWHTSMSCFMILNVVYLRRLLTQEHIQRILRTKR